MTARRGMTLVELLTVIAILSVTGALTYPAMSSAIESGRIQATLQRLRQLSQALSMYRADHESGTIWSGLPSNSYIYEHTFGLPKSMLKSPCGYRSIIPNLNEYSVQYAWEPHPRVMTYFERWGERAVIFTDASCNRSRAIWESPAALKRGLGVRLDGSLIHLVKRGLPIELEWWGR